MLRISAASATPATTPGFDPATRAVPRWGGLNRTLVGIELRRVLRPSGHLLVIDMVDKPVEPRQLPRAVLDELRTRARALRFPGYRRRLAAMVRDPRWQDMLRYNPMRALHEYVWYLGSRFPQGRMDTINTGRRARIIAFDSGPFAHAEITEMQYP